MLSPPGAPRRRMRPLRARRGPTKRKEVQEEGGADAGADVGGEDGVGAEAARVDGQGVLGDGAGDLGAEGDEAVGHDADVGDVGEVGEGDGAVGEEGGGEHGEGGILVAGHDVVAGEGFAAADDEFGHGFRGCADAPAGHAGRPSSRA